MNKRGAVFHWVLFGILIALAIILSASKTGFVTTELKGQWPIDFLKNNYFEAQTDNLKFTVLGKEVGSITAIELGKNGGFNLTSISDCGKHKGKNLWNKVDRFCYPEHIQQVKSEAIKQFKDKGVVMNEIFFAGTTFMGFGEEQTIDNEYGKYTYKNQFLIDIGYDFNEYDILFQQASNLLVKCQGVQDLDLCLQLPVNWYVEECGNSQPIVDAKVAFCAKGSERLAVEHHFALDFTS